MVCGLLCVVCAVGIVWLVVSGSRSVVRDL